MVRNTAFPLAGAIVILLQPLCASADSLHAFEFDTAYATTRGVLNDNTPTIVYDRRDGSLTLAIDDQVRVHSLDLRLAHTAPFAFNRGVSNWREVLGDTPTRQAGRDVVGSQFELGRLLPEGLNEQSLLDHLTITWDGPCIETLCLLTGGVGDLIVTNEDLVLPAPPPPPMIGLTLLYDYRTGELSIGESSEGVFSTITLEIKDATDGLPPPVDFLFNTLAAPAWEGQDVFQFKDEAKLQGFITVPGVFGSFVMEAGDTIGAILPPHQAESVLNHVEVQFNKVGALGTLERGESVILIIPEPSSIILALTGLVGLWVYARQSRCRRHMVWLLTVSSPPFYEP